MELKLVPTVDRSNTCALLIVPYGIETVKFRPYHIIAHSFNRTLWN